MAPRSVPGICLLCREPVTKRAVLRHVGECLASSGGSAGEKPSLLIRIEGRRARSFWLIAVARADATLEDLDALIRGVWVECCGHLSAFTIGGEEYLSGDDESDMAVPLERLLSPGTVFSYEYDFGSPTRLDLEVIGTAPMLPPESPIRVLVRNEPPPVACETCGEAAEFRLQDDELDLWHFFCRDCLAAAEPDPECVELIENSPRDGVCGYVEDPDAAVSWYPPGWSAEELASRELEEFLESLPGFGPDDGIVPAGDQYGEAEMHAMFDAVSADIGPEVEAFIEEEQAAHGDHFAALAEETVMEFCTFMYGFHGKAVREWDAPLVRRCLLTEMAQNPVFPDEWLDNAVPILCRFVAHMEAAGRLRNAADLAADLTEAEPEFRDAATSPEKYQDLSDRLFQRALDAGINPEDGDALTEFVVREVAVMAGLDPDDADLVDEMIGTLPGCGPTPDELQAAMILSRCEEYCTRLDDDMIGERCGAIVESLAAHPAAPLMRGNADLWSAAIVYAACRDADLIRPAKGGSPLAQEIGSFFGCELASIRSKVTTLKKYLPKTPNTKD